MTTIETARTLLASASPELQKCRLCLCNPCQCVKIGWHGIKSADGDWLEDAKHENGNYYCTCSICGGAFTGHKRRVICKKCAKREDKGGKQ